MLMALTITYHLYAKFSAPAQTGSEHFSQQTTVQTADAEVKRALTPFVAETGKTAEIQKSMVVLPFVNMSNDPDQEFFSDGLSEELLNVLAQIKDLRVISQTSAFAFKGKKCRGQSQVPEQTTLALDSDPRLPQAARLSSRYWRNETQGAVKREAQG